MFSHETSERFRIIAVRRGGERALKARKHPGRKPKPPSKQKLQVRRWINGRDPRQYGFDLDLWTRRIVAELVKEKFAMHIRVTAVGRLLSELDITPQKPLRRAYERDPIAIERWKTQEFLPAVAARVSVPSLQ
jgi:transposase